MISARSLPPPRSCDTARPRGARPCAACNLSCQWQVVVRTLQTGAVCNELDDEHVPTKTTASRRQVTPAFVQTAKPNKSQKTQGAAAAVSGSLQSPTKDKGQSWRAQPSPRGACGPRARSARHGVELTYCHLLVQTSKRTNMQLTKSSHEFKLKSVTRIFLTFWLTRRHCSGSSEQCGRAVGSGHMRETYHMQSDSWDAPVHYASGRQRA